MEYGFEDWLVVRGILSFPHDELKALCLLRLHNDGAAMKDFTAKGIPSKAVLSLVQKQLVSEFPSGVFNLLPFWKVESVPFDGVSVSDEKKKVNTPYALFAAWKKKFGVDISTDGIRMQMLHQAKRMLKSRDLDYWVGIMDAALKDPFWKNSCRNSITTLEKAAMSLSDDSGSKGGRYDRLSGEV